VETKKDAVPSIAERATDVWTTLTDRQRTELIEKLTELALERIEQLAQAHRSPANPSGWYSMQWKSRGGHPLAAFTIAARETGA
jgi:hypothetical protein